MQLLHLHPQLDSAVAKAAAEASSFGEVFDISRPLAFHSECLVSLAKARANGQSVVVKSYVKDRLNRLGKEQVDTEAHIHASLSHSAVVPLLLVAEDTRHIYLVMEYADGGDLRRQMASIGERRLRDSVIQPLLSALVLLHQQGVVHRDVKPDNVLMHRNSAQLADFGLAVYCNPSQPSSRRHSYLEQQQAASAAKDREPSLPLQNQVSMSSMQSSYSTALVDCSIASASTIGSSASTAAALEECTGCHSDSEQSEQDTAVLVDDLHMRTSANSDAAALDAAAHTVSAHQLLCHSRLRRPISSPELMASASGTPLYTAPEVLLAMFQSRPVHDVVSHKNDIWALGVMMLEALSGEHPFSGSAAAQHNGNVLYSIAHHTSVRIPSHISPDCADFILKAMQRDPALRPSAEELLQHPFMTRSLSGGGAALGLSRLVITPRCSQEAAVSPRWQQKASDYSSGGAGVGWGASGPSFTGASGHSPMAQWPAPAAAPGCGIAAAGGFSHQAQQCRKPISSGGAAAVRAFLTADSWEY